MDTASPQASTVVGSQDELSCIEAIAHLELGAVHIGQTVEVDRRLDAASPIAMPPSLGMSADPAPTLPGRKCPAAHSTKTRERRGTSRHYEGMAQQPDRYPRMCSFAARRGVEIT